MQDPKKLEELLNELDRRRLSEDRQEYVTAPGEAFDQDQMNIAEKPLQDINQKELNEFTESKTDTELRDEIKSSLSGISRSTENTETQRGIANKIDDVFDFEKDKAENYNQKLEGDDEDKIEKINKEEEAKKINLRNIRLKENPTRTRKTSRETRTDNANTSGDYQFLISTARGLDPKYNNMSQDEFNKKVAFTNEEQILAEKHYDKLKKILTDKKIDPKYHEALINYGWTSVGGMNAMADNIDKSPEQLSKKIFTTARDTDYGNSIVAAGSFYRGLENLKKIAELKSENIKEYLDAFTNEHINREIKSMLTANSNNKLDDTFFTNRLVRIKNKPNYYGLDKDLHDYLIKNYLKIKESKKNEVISLLGPEIAQKYYNYQDGGVAAQDGYLKELTDLYPRQEYVTPLGQSYDEDEMDIYENLKDKQEEIVYPEKEPAVEEEKEPAVEEEKKPIVDKYEPELEYDMAGNRAIQEALESSPERKLSLKEKLLKELEEAKGERDKSRKIAQYADMFAPILEGLNVHARMRSTPQLYKGKPIQLAGKMPDLTKMIDADYKNKLNEIQKELKLHDSIKPSGYSHKDDKKIGDKIVRYNPETKQYETVYETPQKKDDIQERGEQRRADKFKFDQLQELRKVYDKNKISTFYVYKRKIQDILDKYKGKDIPGIGVLGSKNPDIGLKFLSKEQRQDAIDLRQLVQSLVNAKLKITSGTAVTQNEFDRMMKELGGGEWNTEETFKRGIQKVFDVYDVEKEYNDGIFKVTSPDLVKTMNKVLERAYQRTLPKKSFKDKVKSFYNENKGKRGIETIEDAIRVLKEKGIVE